MTGTAEPIRLGDRDLTLIRIPSLTDGPSLMNQLQRAGLPIGRPVVVLVGGADGLNLEDAASCEHIFGSALVPAIEEAGAVLVDGGTDSGIIRIVGQVRQHAAAQNLHVGVVAAGTVHWPDRPSRNTDTADLEPHHTHIVAVPGDHWGDEAPWISATATALSADAPSVTVLANGGLIAYEDVQRSIATDRPVLVLSGTGRAAAHIAAALNGQSADLQAVHLARSSLLTALPNDPDVVRAALTAALSH